jgi:hypothetical protein
MPTPLVAPMVAIVVPFAVLRAASALVGEGRIRCDTSEHRDEHEGKHRQAKRRPKAISLASRRFHNGLTFLR